MKVCGFSFVRNAVKFGYPVAESIKSVLPICDEFVISIGNSEDETEALIKTIDSPKIRIIHSIWDDSLRKDGRVLSVETNKAFDSIPDEFDWAFYIQADEVVHEKFLDTIYSSMKQWKENRIVDGLLFKYLHFYGTFDYTGDSRQWYRNEIRIIRNNKNIRSYKDAQGFRINNEKLKVKPIDACIYHYGWVKHPSTMKNKEKYFHTLWHDNKWMQENVKNEDLFDYSNVDSIIRFTGSHPEVMTEHVKKMNWEIELDMKKKNFDLKNRLLYKFEKSTGIRLFEYKNYRVV
jgi:hypothetical protein